jgi:mRNA interferase HicA
MRLKQRDLIKKFEKQGWYFLRNGGNHDIYTNGKDKEKIPRHREVSEGLAKDLIRKWGL